MSGRSNGLQALAYAPLTDLDPRLADSVLDALRLAGIAAYVVPSPGQTGGYRDVRLPDRPKDRLWVDASAIERARTVVDGTLPPGDPAPLDEDEAWRAIVAGFEEGPTTPVPPWPVSEDLDDTAADPRGRGRRRFEPGEPTAAARPLEEPRDGEPEDGEPLDGEPLDGEPLDGEPLDGEPLDGELAPQEAGADADGRGPAGQAAQAAEDDAEHYVPPPPPPLPRASPVTTWAWVALFGGIAVLLAPVAFGWDLEGWMALLGVAGIVGGFVTLVARLGDGPPRDSGPDDGAVV